MAQPVQRLVLMVNVDSLERTYVLDRNYIHDTVVSMVSVIVSGSV